jgi:hypothetical protein
VRIQVDQILGQILRQAVWERLDMLDELATNADGPSLASVARTELPRLTEGWRALLKAHEPDRKGNCPSCSSRWRPQKAPCSVWQAAHQHLVTPEQPSVPQARPVRQRAPRPIAHPRPIAMPQQVSHGHGGYHHHNGHQLPPVRRAALR